MKKTSEDTYSQKNSGKPAPPRILHFRCKSEHHNLLEGLAQETGVGLQQLQNLLEIGAIYRDGRRLTATDHLLKSGQYLRVHLKPRRFELPKGPAQKHVAAETEDFIVGVKPEGLPTHATLDNAHENFLWFLSQAYGPLLPAQRLDQMTRGLVLYARNKEFLTQFQRWQKQGLVKKIYLAFTAQALPLGEHVHFTGPKSAPPRPMSLTAKPGDQRCVLDVLSCDPQKDPASFCSRIQLITGRTHQIRAQLAALGAPLLGDQLYGSDRQTYPPSPLWASELGFPGQDLKLTDV